MKYRLMTTTVWLSTVLMSTVSVAAGDPVGTWEAVTPQGTMTLKLMKGDDGALTGEMTADQLGTVPLDEVSLDGDTLDWYVEIDMGGQIIEMNYSGSLQGDGIDGVLDVGEFGEFPLPLTRVPAEPDPVAGGLAGEWDLEYEIQGNAVTAKLTLEKADDGSFSGTWDSQYGKSELTNLKVDGDSATFDRSISAQGQSMDISYSAMAEADAISGTISIPQLGDVPFKGTRVGGAVVAGHLGEWNLEVDAQGQVFEILLTVEEGDDGLAINTSTQMGDATGSDAQFEDGTLSFLVSVDANGQQMEFEYNLKFNGDEVEGTIGSEFGEMPVTGKRAE